MVRAAAALIACVLVACGRKQTQAAELITSVGAVEAAAHEAGKTLSGQLMDANGAAYLVESVQLASLVVDWIDSVRGPSAPLKLRISTSYKELPGIEITLEPAETSNSFVFAFRMTLPGSAKIESFTEVSSKCKLSMEFLIEGERLTGVSVHTMEVVLQTPQLRSHVAEGERLDTGGSLRMNRKDAAWVPIFLERRSFEPEWLSRFGGEVPRAMPDFDAPDVQLFEARLLSLVASD